MKKKNKQIQEEEKAVYTADNCLSCTSCMASCPVMEASREYRGPKLVGPAHSRMHFSQEDIEDSLEFCSNCKACDRSCPSGVAVSTLNMLQRGAYYQTHGHSQRDDMLAHGERMAKLVRAMPLGAKMANWGMKAGKALGVFGTLGLAGKRSMPAYAPASFMKLFRKIRQQPCEKKVVFYPGCFINDYTPEVGVAFVKVMQRNQIEVLVDPAFNCCGSPMVTTGFLDEAKQHATNNAARILAWKAQDIPVVACCTSCSLMLKQEYAELFAEESMKEAGTNVYDAFEYLELMQDNGELDQDFRPVEQRLLYHVPCHLKSQGIGTPAADILRQIPGVQLELADAGCCGMSGNYGFKKDKYEISMKIGEALFQRIRDYQADKVISDCGTCRLQINHGTQAKTCHPIEILAQAYQ